MKEALPLERSWLLLEEKLSAELTDEVFAAEGGAYRSTNSPQYIRRSKCLLHTSSVTNRFRKTD